MRLHTSLFLSACALLAPGLVLASVERMAHMDLEPSKPLQSLSFTTEFRPSFRTDLGSFFSEDFAQANFRFGPSTLLVYRQQVLTQGSNGTSLGSRSSTVRLGEGSLRFYSMNLLNPFPGTKLSYEARLVLPTQDVSHWAGGLFQLWNLARLTRKLTESVAAYVEDGPIGYAYDRDQFFNGVRSVANPLVENRLNLGVDWNPSPRWRLSFPVALSSILYRSGAVNAFLAGQWIHQVWIWPEADYRIFPNTELGVAFRSGNLVSTHLEAVNLVAGLSAGAAQAVVRSYW